MGGGDTSTTHLSSSSDDDDDPEEDSTLAQDFAQPISLTPSFFRYNSGMKIEDKDEDEDGAANWDNIFGESDLLDTEKRRRQNVRKEVWETYFRVRSSKSSKEAKSKILSYKPGKWIEKSGGMKSSDYDVPETTSLILIGPKGSGKSSLVNRITKVLEDDKFAPERAQVSYSSLSGDGTCFLHEYMIPRGSTSFSIYDTRGLDSDLSDNVVMMKRWITRGVRHGELIIRDSDTSTDRDKFKTKARGHGCQFSEIKMVNFVVFVVNGVDVLKSMKSSIDSDTLYTRTVATAFNCPYLSFKDDKPLVVVTHGDLLSVAERVNIRVYLGDILGIPPSKQIFDIAESDDPFTEMTILDMMCYSLEHADRNLHPMRRNREMNKVSHVFRILLMMLWITVISIYLWYKTKLLPCETEPELDIDCK